MAEENSFLGVNPYDLKPDKILFNKKGGAEVSYKIADKHIKVIFGYSSKTEHDFGIKGLDRTETFQNVTLKKDDDIIKNMSYMVEYKYNKENYTHKGKVDLYENLHDLCGCLTCYPGDAEDDLPSLAEESPYHKMIFIAACDVRHKIEEQKEQLRHLKDKVCAQTEPKQPEGHTQSPNSSTSKQPKLQQSDGYGSY